MNSNSREYIGQKFGHWTVLDVFDDEDKKDRWLCQCDCTTVKEVSAKSLKRGTSKSCGCAKGKMVSDALKKYNSYEVMGDYTTLYTLKNEPFYIDTEDLERVLKYCWRLDKEGYIVATSYNGHSNRIIYLHRFIMNCPNECVVDHIHGINSHNDNRKENLRIGNQMQNQMNRKINKNNKSGCNGVYWSKANKKWLAQIVVNKKKKYLGLFTNLEDAIEARKKAEKEYFGEWSYDNSQNKSINTRGDVK